MPNTAFLSGHRPRQPRPGGYDLSAASDLRFRGGTLAAFVHWLEKKGKGFKGFVIHATRMTLAVAC
jgi:hypothetical protein